MNLDYGSLEESKHLSLNEDNLDQDVIDIEMQNKRIQKNRDKIIQTKKQNLIGSGSDDFDNFKNESSLSDDKIFN